MKLSKNHKILLGVAIVAGLVYWKYWNDTNPNKVSTSTASFDGGMGMEHPRKWANATANDDVDNQEKHHKHHHKMNSFDGGMGMEHPRKWA